MFIVLLFWDLRLKMSEGSKEWQALPDYELLTQWPWGQQGIAEVLCCDLLCIALRCFSGFFLLGEATFQT